jgi:hypothetical protein
VRRDDLNEQYGDRSNTAAVIGGGAMGVIERAEVPVAIKNDNVEPGAPDRHVGAFGPSR